MFHICKHMSDCLKCIDNTFTQLVQFSLRGRGVRANANALRTAWREGGGQKSANFAYLLYGWPLAIQERNDILFMKIHISLPLIIQQRGGNDLNKEKWTVHITFESLLPCRRTNAKIWLPNKTLLFPQKHKYKGTRHPFFHFLGPIKTNTWWNSYQKRNTCTNGRTKTSKIPKSFIKHNKTCRQTNRNSNLVGRKDGRVDGLTNVRPCQKLMIESLKSSDGS